MRARFVRSITTAATRPVRLSREVRLWLRSSCPLGLRNDTYAICEFAERDASASWCRSSSRRALVGRC